MSKTKQRTLIIMCWLLYVAAYLGRYSYNSNILPMSIHYGASDTAMGLATSFFFFAYGAGQIVNGLLCRYYKVKYVLSGALIISAVINGVIFLGIIPFALIKVLWLFNGLAQSVLWSSLLMVLSRNLDENYIKKAIIAMSTTASVGVLLSYGLSALFALFNGFRFSFLAGALVMTVAAALWIILYDNITEKQVIVTETASENVKQKTDKSVIKILFIFGAFAVIINLIKDGLSTWVPKILFDTFSLSESLSILLTLLVPILTVFGTTLVVMLNKKIKDYTALIAILFSVASIFVGIILICLKTPFWGIVLAAFGLISLLMSGANNVVTSILPLSLRDKANSGFLAGILNGCCYVGSTFSSVGLGAISDHYGEWTPVFNLLLYLTIAVVLIAVAVMVVNMINNRKKKVVNTETPTETNLSEENF